MKEIKQRNVNSFSESVKFSKQNLRVSLTVQVLFHKAQDTKSLNLFRGFTTLVRVRLVSIAGTGSGGISDTGAEQVLVTGSGKFALFSFRSGTAAIGCSLATSEGTSSSVLETDCSLGLRKCLPRQMLSLLVFTR